MTIYEQLRESGTHICAYLYRRDLDGELRARVHIVRLWAKGYMCTYRCGCVSSAAVLTTVHSYSAHPSRIGSVAQSSDLRAKCGVC